MLPKLSDRAAMRCTSNITRFYPAWKQAQLRQSGGDALNDMLDFIDVNKAHLADLKQRIAEGETPCIDTGWPVLGGKVETAPEPQVIEKIIEVEKVVEVAREDTTRLEELENRLKAAQDALAARSETVMPDTGPEPIEASYDEPPAEIADLIDPSLTPKQNLDVLTAKFAAAKNLEEYARNNGDMTGAMQHLRDAERFESGIKWNRAVLVEVV